MQLAAYLSGCGLGLGLVAAFKLGRSILLSPLEIALLPTMKGLENGDEAAAEHWAHGAVGVALLVTAFALQGGGVLVAIGVDAPRAGLAEVTSVAAWSIASVSVGALVATLVVPALARMRQRQAAAALIARYHWKWPDGVDRLARQRGIERGPHEGREAFDRRVLGRHEKVIRSARASARAESRRQEQQ